MTPAADPLTSEPTGRLHETVWTVLAGAIALVLYVVTMCPTVYTLDAPELTAAAGVFGVAHPPGYPLFTMLYGSLARVLAFGDLALRTNVISAALAALTVGLIFRCGRALGASRGAALAGALGIAVARDWWLQGVSTEVYALDGLLLALALLATASVARNPAPRAWTLLGLAFGLACGHRTVNVLFLLALLAWAEIARRRSGAPIGRYARFVTAGVATAAIWLFLPFAAGRDPPMNMGDPSDGGRLWIVLTAAPYARHLGSTDAGLVMGRIVQYATSLPAQLGLTTVAALAGAFLLRRAGGSSRTAGLGIVGFAALNLLFVVIFNIPDGESFLQPTWVATGALAAIGYDAARRRLGGLGSAVVVVVSMLPAIWTYGVVDLSNVRTVDTYGKALLDSARPGALIVAYDDTARNAMVFQQVVRHVGTDRAVVDVSAPLPWHLEETTRRTVGFDLAGAAGEGWISRLAQVVVRDPSRGLYLTDIAGVELAPLLGSELAARAIQVPSGLLYRVVVLDDLRDAGPISAGIAAEADAAFWTSYTIDQPARAHHDPQLAAVVIRSAQTRFLLAVTYVLAGRTAAAVPHLEALSAMDVDVLEHVVIDDLATVGRAPAPWRMAARSRRGLEAIRRGAAPREVAQALAPQ